MNKLLPYLCSARLKIWIILLIVSVLPILLNVKTAHAQVAHPEYKQDKGVSVGATVGSNFLTVSGFQSPFASIILKTQNGTFLTSTTADSKGYFSISNLLINGINLNYCFQAVDFKRVGESDACITIDTSTNIISYPNIFLPPTIGLSKKQINAGQDAILYGYSMPGATVFLDIEGNVVTVIADDTGYYTYIYKNVKEGVFRISATSTLQDKKSLTPTNQVILESLSVQKQITNTVKKVTEKVKKAASNDFLLFMLAALLLLTGIGLMLYKLRLRLWVIIIDFFRRRKKMHHDWFLDKW